MRTPSPFVAFMRDKFTLHMNIYRLILGAVVLAVVVPFWASGHQPMWPVALLALFAVTAAGVLLARRAPSARVAAPLM
jgi:MFS superfamily sulfate permease-like transporter